MLDFEILETGNIKSMVFVDLSEYQERPSNPMLEVRFPSISEHYKMLVRPKEMVNVTTKLLGFTRDIEDFPDGLYHLTYSNDPNSKKYVCKKYFRLVETKCRIKSLLLKEDITKETTDKLYKLDIYIQAIDVVDTNKALEYFKLIQKELKKLECHV